MTFDGGVRTATSRPVPPHAFISPSNRSAIPGLHRRNLAHITAPIIESARDRSGAARRARGGSGPPARAIGSGRTPLLPSQDVQTERNRAETAEPAVSRNGTGSPAPANPRAGSRGIIFAHKNRPPSPESSHATARPGPSSNPPAPMCPRSTVLATARESTSTCDADAGYRAKKPAKGRASK